MTRTRPSFPTSTLSGLKSRWTSPAACAAASPRPADWRTASRSRSEWPPSSHSLQRSAVDELHRKVHAPVEDADVVNDDDVGVRQAGHRLRLSLQAHADLVASLASRELSMQDLDRQRAIELRVVGAVHRAHTAPAEHPHDDVAVDHLAARELCLGCGPGGASRGAIGRDCRAGRCVGGEDSDDIG